MDFGLEKVRTCCRPDGSLLPTPHRYCLDFWWTFLLVGPGMSTLPHIFTDHCSRARGSVRSESRPTSKAIRLSVLSRTYIPCSSRLRGTPCITRLDIVLVITCPRRRTSMSRVAADDKAAHGEGAGGENGDLSHETMLAFVTSSPQALRVQWTRG